MAHPTADNVKVVLRVRPSTSTDSTWAVTAKEDGGPSLQLLDAKGVPVTTYGLGACGGRGGRCRRCALAHPDSAAAPAPLPPCASSLRAAH